MEHEFAYVKYLKIVSVGFLYFETISVRALRLRPDILLSSKGFVIFQLFIDLLCYVKSVSKVGGLLFVTLISNSGFKDRTNFLMCEFFSFLLCDSRSSFGSASVACCRRKCIFSYLII